MNTVSYVTLPKVQSSQELSNQKFMNYLIRKEERFFKRKIFMVSCYLLYPQMIDSFIRTGTLCTLFTVLPLCLQYPEPCPERKWCSVNMFD